MRGWAKIAFLGLALAPVIASGDSSPRVTLATPGIGDGAIERFTMRFSDAMVPLGDPRAAAPYKMDCAVSGEGRWVDQQTYVWDYAHGLPGGTVCKAKLDDGLKSVAGYAVSGQSEFTIDAGGPVTRAVLPDVSDEDDSDNGGGIEEDQVFLVAANLAPTPQSVATNAYCAVDGLGEKIPVDVLSPELPAKLLGAMGTDDWKVSSFLEKAGVPGELPKSQAERQRALSGVTALRCRRALPPGRDMSLVWGANIAGANGKLAGEDQRFDYTVRKPFTARFECSRVNPQAGCNPVEKAYVRFSAPIPTETAKAIRIQLPDGRQLAPHFDETAKGSDAKTAATTSDVEFAAPLPFATGAKLLLPAGVKDESGRTLANAERFPLDIRFDRAPPLVKFAASFGILEASEGGVLPVTVRNVEPALQGRNLAVDGRSLKVGDSDAAIAEWLRTVAKADEEKSHPIDDQHPEKRINDTGSAPILSGEGKAMSVPLPGKGRDFEVVGIPLAKPGFYVVELASPTLGRALLGRDAPRYVATAALVTNMAVHFEWGRERSLAWVTALDTGKPVANAQVQVSDSCTGEVFAKGTTDKSGGLNVPEGLPEPASYSNCEYGTNHALMVSARKGGDMSFVLTEWGQGIQPYDFDLPYGYSAQSEIIHTVFDRALVRQGETIHMKHIVRKPNGNGFALGPGFKGTLRLSHRGDDTTFDLPLAIDANGVGETQWTAPKGAPLGDYDIQVIKDGDPNRVIDTSQSFKVDEYRLPTMRATVNGPKEAAVRPKSLPLDLFVGYLSGGGAANLPVEMRIGYFGRTATPEGYEKYTFGGDDVKEGVKPLNGQGEEDTPSLPPTQTMPATLKADGTRQIVADVPQTLDAATDMQVEMDYQDANGETLTASSRIPIYPSAVQLGIATDGWMMKQDDLRLRFVALDLDGKPIKGKKISVALYSRQILTARRRLIGGFYAYDNNMRTTKLAATCSTTTDAQGLASCKIDPGVSGEIYAVATTTDSAGHVARATQSVWLAGDDDWWFGGDNGDRMDVVPEKIAYASGDTARLQVRMPFRSATALVSVEREGVLSSFVTEISGKDPVIEVKLPASYAPDVFVSVLAVRGRTTGFWSWLANLAHSWGLKWGGPEYQPPTATVDLAKPAYRLGIAKLKVGWEGHRLAVVLKADRERYPARGVAQTLIQVRRTDGTPARSADVAFMAVDQALLQLAPNDSTDVLTAMMGERPLSVLTSTAQTQVVGKRHYGRKAVEAGGGGGADVSGLNRENFQPILLWRGHVPLDAQGRAKVAVPLNDSLSSFKLVAVATDGAQLFGSGETNVRTAQDLTIYGGLPPIVRNGDRYAAGFTLRNGSDHAMTVTAVAALNPVVARGNPITVTIPAGGAAPIAWNLTAPVGEGTLSWHVTARSSDSRATDQVTVTQQVTPAVPVEVWAAALNRVGDNTLIPIGTPAGALPGRGSVDIRLNDTLAPPMAGVMRFMAYYPYDCLEQRISRAIALGRAEGWNAIAGDLPVYQASDGLLRYWPSDTMDGSEALTSYVLSITSEAHLQIPDGPRTKMIEALKAVLDGRLRHETYGDVRLQRLAAFAALARAGAATPAMLGQIGITPGEMPTAALGDYIMALDRVPGIANANALRAKALDTLRTRFVYEGERLDLTDTQGQSWWMMDSGDVAAIKAMMVALGRPGWQDDAPKITVGVASRQDHGHWDTTTANAWGAIAVRRFARLYPAAAITGTTTLSLGGRTINKAWPLADANRAASFALPAVQSPLRMTQSGGAGPWANVSVSAAVPLLQPLYAGYRMSRQVAAVEQKHPGRWTKGDVMRVAITVEASAERNWVVVNDPIPAGATIVSDLGGQSQLLASQEQAGNGQRFNATDANGKKWLIEVGVQPAYIERRQDSYRGFFSWVPRGKFTIVYLLRLNGVGTLNLPPSRVEAMYSPAIRAQLPNQPVTVAQR